MFAYIQRDEQKIARRLNSMRLFADENAAELCPVHASVASGVTMSSP